MIAARGGDDAARQCRLVEPEEPVGRPARLERASDLQQFELEQQPIAAGQRRFEPGRGDRRRAAHIAGNPARSPVDVVKLDDHAMSPS